MKAPEECQLEKENKFVCDELIKEVSSRKKLILNFFDQCLKRSEVLEDLEECRDYFNRDLGILHNEFSFKIENYFIDETFL